MTREISSEDAKLVGVWLFNQSKFRGGTGMKAINVEYVHEADIMSAVITGDEDDIQYRLDTVKNFKQ
jgi:hypothetical protein